MGHFTPLAVAGFPSERDETPHVKRDPVKVRRDTYDSIQIHIGRGDCAAAATLLMNADHSQIDNPIALFNRLLIAYVDSGQNQEAMRLFHILTTDPKLPSPDSQSHNIYLKSLPREQRESFLMSMIEIEHAQLESFNFVIATYCDMDRAQDAQRVLELMIKCSESRHDLQPDLITFTPLIKLAGRMLSPEASESIFEAMIKRGIQPDVICWSAVIHAWSKSGRPDAPENAMRLLEEMVHTTNPDTAIYNVVMLAFAKSKNRAHDAEALLRNMSARPSMVTFATCLLAWRNSFELPGAVQKAEALVEEMKQRYNMKPNNVVLTNLIAIYARCQLPEKAESVLAEMEEPHPITYVTVLDAWGMSAKSDSIDRGFYILKSMKTKPNTSVFNAMVTLISKNGYATKTLEALAEVRKLMEQKGCMPDIRFYCASLKVCGNSKSRDEALQAISNMIRELRSNHTAERNGYIYSALFSALAKQRVPKEDVERYLQCCIDDGCLDDVVVRILRERKLCDVQKLKELSSKNLVTSPTRRR